MLFAVVEALRGLWRHAAMLSLLLVLMAALAGAVKLWGTEALIGLASLPGAPVVAIGALLAAWAVTVVAGILMLFRPVPRIWFAAAVAIAPLACFAGMCALVGGPDVGPMLVALSTVILDLVAQTTVGIVFYAVVLLCAQPGPASSAAIFERALRAWPALLVPVGLSITAVSLGLQFLVPGLALAVVTAFVPAAALLDPDRPVIRAALHALGRRPGSTLLVLTASTLAGLAGTLLVMVVAVGRSGLAVAMFDPSTVPAWASVVSSVLWLAYMGVREATLGVLYHPETPIPIATPAEAFDPAAVKDNPWS